MDTIQINNLKRSIGTLMIKAGMMQVRDAVDFEKKQILSRVIDTSCKNFGITPNELDGFYQTTSWDNWKKIIDILYTIIKDFKWKAETADCDNRSALMTSLCSMLFDLNTCSQCYCEVYDATTNVLKYLHWCNVVIDDNGNLFLFDVDQSGLTQKITSNNLVMGVNKYHLLQLRIY